ncbi:hypothetical protein KC19_4G178500 [Ceratodon purpureus]|uniref:Protein kinase domain-containing protein n=1 Tax=Ceratodon purpureus TaxID=3225 RepID=A0A8T0IC40_CERPU|nr:hypothetical protein KC19_4G178500 [Ceratodon purpureus]
MRPKIWLCFAEVAWMEFATDDQGTLDISRITKRINLRPEFLGKAGANDGITIEMIRLANGSTAGESEDTAVPVLGSAQPAAHLVDSTKLPVAMIWLRSAEGLTWMEFATDDQGTLDISRITKRINLRPEFFGKVGADDGITIEKIRAANGSTAGESEDTAVLVLGSVQPAAHLVVDRRLFEEFVAELSFRKAKRHKTAYTDSIPIPVDEVQEVTLWEHEVEKGGVPCTTEHVDMLLDPERALLADLRYLHLWHIARNKPAGDIVRMKRSRNRSQADLEQVYYSHALTIMRASAQGQEEVFVLGEDHTFHDSARGDLRVYVRNMEHPSEMKAVNGSSNALNDPTGILSNKAAFGKLHNIIRAKLLKEGAGGTFLCTFLNRIECIWFAKLEYDSERRMIRCQVAPQIPAKGLMPSAQICPRLDEILDDNPSDKDVMLADLLDREPPSGFRCLTRYIDTLCRMNDVPIIPVAFMTDDGTCLDMEQARIVARGSKSLIIQVGEEDAVFKVGPHNSIQNEKRNLRAVDGRASNIRVMDQGVNGIVKGVEGLAFIKLKGCGRCISSMSWEQLAEFWTAMEKALSGLHVCSLLHRDIKPDNMLLIDEQLVLNDFDISCLAGDSVQLKQYVGTPEFRSPYWTPGAGVYVPADDWVSLGLSFSWLLSLPRVDDPLRGLIDDPRTPQDMKIKLSAAINHAKARDREFLNLLT